MMRHLPKLLAPLFVVAFATLPPVGEAVSADVGVSISLGQPGFFGRIDIGDAPRPEVVYAQPVVAQRVVTVAPPAPLYLHVPPGHEKHWRKHCREYNACGVPVYFVRDRWYNDVYVKHYQERDHRRGNGLHNGDRHDEGKHHGHENNGHGHEGHGEGHDRD